MVVPPKGNVSKWKYLSPSLCGHGRHPNNHTSSVQWKLCGPLVFYGALLGVRNLQVGNHCHFHLLSTLWSYIQLNRSLHCPLLVAKRVTLALHMQVNSLANTWKCWSSGDIYPLKVRLKHVNQGWFKKLNSELIWYQFVKLRDRFFYFLFWWQQCCKVSYITSAQSASLSEIMPHSDF